MAGNVAEPQGDKKSCDFLQHVDRKNFPYKKARRIFVTGGSL